MSLSTNKYRCSTAEQGHAQHNQHWRAVVSCFQAECPAPGSAAPASLYAHTMTATVPAMVGEHPANTHTAASKVTSHTNAGGEKNQHLYHHAHGPNTRPPHAMQKCQVSTRHNSQDSIIHNCSAPSFPFHFSKPF